MEEEKIECTGKGVFSLIMGVICLAMAIYLLIITIKMEQVIILAYLVVILAFGLAMYYLLYWKHRLTRAHREKQLKMSCQALHNAPPNRT